MKKVIASAGLLALGAVGMQNAQAQTELAAGPEKPWSVAGTLRGFYDDNYATAPNGSPLKKHSWGLEVRPSAAVSFVSGPTTFNLSYVYDLRDFTDRPGNKLDQSHDVELSLNHNFNERYSLDLEDSFVIAQEPELIDPSLATPFRSKGDNIRNTAAINFHGKLTELLGFKLGYANNYYDYKENAGDVAGDPATTPTLSSLLNRDENVVTLDTRWQIFEETVAILGYQFEAVNFNGSIQNVGIGIGPAGPINPDTRNNYSHFGYVGVEQTLRTDLTVSARGGFEYVDYYNAPAGESSSTVSPYGELNVNYRYMDGGALLLGFRHQHNATDLGGVSASGSITLDQESSTVFGSIVQKLTPISPDLTLTLNGQYQNSSFHGGAYDNETDNIYLVGVNLNYQFNHYVSGEVGYNYDSLSSDITGRQYDRNRVYVGVTASY